MYISKKIKLLCFIFVLMIIFSVSGCGGDTISSENSSQSEDISSNDESENNISLDSSENISSSDFDDEDKKSESPLPVISPNTIGLYIPAGDGTATRKLVTEFSSTRTAKTDIDCFEAIASKENTLRGSSFSSIWNNAWNSYTDNEISKIGFTLKLMLKNGESITKTILKPSDSDEFFNYLEIYMYDDINQTPGAWYTHLSDTDIGSDTIISSIKLTSGADIEKVGDIHLAVFVYNDMDNFDALGNYMGTVTYEIIIKNK